jgi:calcineurin-like phosphoesterase family protein
MNYWFTSDYHLGHFNIISYCNRPFDSLEQMNDTIIRNHNSRVKKEDTVFHIGDFCFKNTAGGKAGEGGLVSAGKWESLLNGKIIFIRGNHDANNSVKTIINGLLIQHHGMLVYLVHKPEHYNNLADLNLVGHVHNEWKIQREGKHLLYNVGVDVNRFMPVNFEEIKREIAKQGVRDESVYRERIKAGDVCSFV